MSNVSGQEVAERLRACISGDLSLVFVGESWDQVYAGNVTIRLSTGDEITIFNDCDAVDYVESCRFVDGRVGDYDSWSEEGPSDGDEPLNPAGRLTVDETHQLLALFKLLGADPEPQR